MADDKKMIAEMIVAKAKKPDEKEDSPFPEEEPAEDEGLKVAAEDILAAFDAHDPDLLMAALKNFMDMR